MDPPYEKQVQEAYPGTYFPLHCGKRYRVALLGTIYALAHVWKNTSALNCFKHGIFVPLEEQLDVTDKASETTAQDSSAFDRVLRYALLHVDYISVDGHQQVGG